MLLLLLLAAACLGTESSAAVPSIDDLASEWVDPNADVSAKANITGANRDVATINNFWGAVGIAPEGRRPVDMFAVNSLELPPLSACGINAQNRFGCGRFMVNGQHVSASATRWATHEAGRRSSPLLFAGGVTIESATRMPFEQNGVMWVVKVHNPGPHAATLRVDVELSAAVARYESVGTWVYAVPDTENVDSNTYTPVQHNQSKGVLVCGGSKPAAPAIAGACAQYIFSGDIQPDSTGTTGGSAPNATFSALQVGAGSTLTIKISLAVGVDKASAEAAQATFAADETAFDQVWVQAHDDWQTRWQQAFTPPSTASAASPASTTNDFWSGSLPTLDLAPDAGTMSADAGTDVARVFYMSTLTVVSQMRTNLPIIHSKVWPNGNGNQGLRSESKGFGIGGSRSWWWDEALTSTMLALLEPDGRVQCAALRQPSWSCCVLVCVPRQFLLGIGGAAYTSGGCMRRLR